MNNRLKVTMLASLLAMLITGCGSDGDSSNVSTSDIKGSWVGACDPDGTISEQSYQTVLDNKVQIREVIYDNQSCNPVSTEILHDITYNFNYLLGANFETATGKKTTKIDYTYTGYNIDKGQVSNLPENGVVRYTIIYKENNKVYTGAITSEYNATSDATRPIVIDFTDALETVK